MINVMHLLLISIFALFITSCNKSKDKAHLTVQLTDAPGNFSAVNIDLASVEITGDKTGVVLLNAEPGIYNLLDLSNGASKLIASGDLDAGTVEQIRLILGTNSSVTVNSVEYPLATPSALQSGLKLQVNKVFAPGVSYSILLDFDASQSIVLQGNGQYQLKPVIRTIDTAISGAINGSVTPIGAIATVTATANGISYSTVTNSSGMFLIAGLPAGTYDITVTPILPLLPVTVTSKTVTIGNSTNVGVIAL